MDSWQLWAIAGAVGLSLSNSPSPRRSSAGAIDRENAIVLNSYQRCWNGEGQRGTL
ncbi:MAG: hypothetical protein LVS60_18550 [Nodosilinea sp. LVE1205-7]